MKAVQLVIASNGFPCPQMASEDCITYTGGRKRKRMEYFCCPWSHVLHNNSPWMTVLLDVKRHQLLLELDVAYNSQSL